MPPDPFGPESAERLLRRERRRARLLGVLRSPETIGAGLVVGTAVLAIVGTSVFTALSRSRLDRHVLHTHDAEPVLALLAPHQAEDARASLREDSKDKTWWIHVRIADGYELLPATPRVTGSMTPVLNPEGELVIETNYLVAYAFDADYPEAMSSPLDIVAVDRWEADYLWVDDAR